MVARNPLQAAAIMRLKFRRRTNHISAPRPLSLLINFSTSQKFVRPDIPAHPNDALINDKTTHRGRRWWRVVYLFGRMSLIHIFIVTHERCCVSSTVRVAKVSRAHAYSSKNATQCVMSGVLCIYNMNLWRVCAWAIDGVINICFSEKQRQDDTRAP